MIEGNEKVSEMEEITREEEKNRKQDKKKSDRGYFRYVERENFIVQ